MILFDDTAIAFESKNDNDLLRAYYLFKTVANPSLVKISKVLVEAAQRIHFPVSWAVKPTIYRQFVGGESIGNCFKLVRVLEKYHVKAILDYSVEGMSSEAIIQHTLEETLRTIDNAAIDINVPFAVFKPTALCSHEVLEKAADPHYELTETERGDASKFKERIAILCKRAFEKGVRLMIDAEDSWYQSFVDDVITEMMMLYNKERAIVFNTLQMYRTDRLDFLKASYEKAVANNYYLGVKFVRGAYMEKERERALQIGYPSPIHPDKQATDNAFDAALQFSIDHLDRISIFCGTHNENSCRLFAALMEKQGLSKDDERCFFSQLYGMSDNISFNLANGGYNVAKYIPYGPVKSVLPYLIRRAEENTSIAGQTSRELSLIKKERQRRKSLKNSLS
ncbi:MAG: proline dehydrogenase family protein [Bacteroidetes bacterium]|nr:proline dehydrogenase family protein [Bacteroidota bacterium]